MPPSSETTATGDVVLPDHVDLHARPAAELVRAASRFTAELEIAAGDRDANAKSLLAILALGARAGTRLRLRAVGPDAAAAIDALTHCVSGLRDEHVGT